MDKLSIMDLDTEGHALSIRFPTAEAAKGLKKRAATAVLAVSLVAGGAAAGVALAPSLGRTTTIESGAANVPVPPGAHGAPGAYRQGPASFETAPGAGGAPGAYRPGPARSETAPGAGGAPGAYRPGPARSETIHPPHSRYAR